MTPPFAGKSSPIVKISDLHFAYPTYSDAMPEIWALKGVDLELPSDSISAIMGPTGVGKSTLAHALLGIVPQSTGGRIRGHIEVCGLDPIHTPVAAMARNVGLVFQDPESQFLTESVSQEIAFGLESLGVPTAEMPARIQAELERMDLDQLAGRAPHQLSGGQKQRVAIAAILAMRPNLLVLDEPAASLDQGGAAELLQSLKDLRSSGESSILLITNQADWVAQVADHVAILLDGKVWRQGSPAQIFSQAQDLMAIGLKPPDLEFLRHRLQAVTGRHFQFTSWQQALAELSQLAPPSR